MKRGWQAAWMVALLLPIATYAQDEDSDPAKRIEELERRLQELEEKVAADDEEPVAESADEGEPSDSDAPVEGDAGDEHVTIMDQLSEFAALDETSWLNRFTLGGYGDIHANFVEGKKKGDQFDIHRLVLTLGYDFADWLSFYTEIEIEHAFVSDGDGGDLVLEQAFVDINVNDPINFRIGRVLIPVGIINMWHEPPSFYGVERPSFAKNIVPSTWFSDGFGMFGTLAPGVKYQAYVVPGLDGPKFNSTDGIRGGRLKERPSLNEPAFTARVDFYPFTSIDPGLGQTLRIGLSTYAGGLDNGNKGANPDVEGEIHLYSADFQYTIWRIDLRGAIAYIRIDDAKEIGNNAPSQILGMYIEVAAHVLPDSVKTGILKGADVVVFARYDDYNTQHRTPHGVPRDGAGNRHDITFGVSVYLVPNLVLKADYQIRDDRNTKNLPDLLNFGVGFQF